MSHRHLLTLWRTDALLLLASVWNYKLNCVSFYASMACVECGKFHLFLWETKPIHMNFMYNLCEIRESQTDPISIYWRVPHTQWRDEGKKNSRTWCKLLTQTDLTLVLLTVKARSFYSSLHTAHPHLTPGIITRANRVKMDRSNCPHEYQYHATCSESDRRGNVNPCGTLAFPFQPVANLGWEQRRAFTESSLMRRSL
jgi:hypothetical protein